MTELATPKPLMPYRPAQPLPDLRPWSVHDPEYEEARSRALRLKKERDEISRRENELRTQVERLTEEFAADAEKALSSAGDATIEEAFEKPLMDARKKLDKLRKQLENEHLKRSAADVSLMRAEARMHQIFNQHREELSLQLAGDLRSRTVEARQKLEEAVRELEMCHRGYNHLLQASNSVRPRHTEDTWGLPQISPAERAWKQVGQATGAVATLQSLLVSALQARRGGAELAEMVVGEGMTDQVDVARAQATADELEAAALGVLVSEEGAS